MKQCSTCKIFKFPKDFGKRSSSKDKLRSQCKECELLYRKKYYQKNIDKCRKSSNERMKKIKLENPELLKERAKKTYSNNKQKVKEKVKKYREANKEKIKLYYTSYRIKNKDKIKYHSKKYSIENKEKINLYRRQKRLINKVNKPKIDRKEYIKLWREKNKEKYLSYCKKYKLNKIKNDLLFRPRLAFSQGIRNALKNKGGKLGKSWSNFVNFTLDEFKKHLESKFTKGMTWENYGKNGWHIDHIIPHYHFKYDSFMHPAFKACWSLQNLQPLWATTEIAMSYGEDKNYVGNLEKQHRVEITREIEDFLKTINN